MSPRDESKEETTPAAAAPVDTGSSTYSSHADSSVIDELLSSSDAERKADPNP